MIKSLKIKILLSFSLLILMLAVAGIMSILEFRNMGHSVDKVLKNNYESIESAKLMLDAAEREDSGVLMWMIGDTESGQQTIQASDSIIREAIVKTQKNITEQNEGEYISKIIDAYEKYHASVQKILQNKTALPESKKIYDSETQTHFFNTKKTINDLMVLNQDEMYKQSSIVKEKSKRAMMPAIVSIVAAVIFAILLNFFITIYFINPLKQLIKSVKGFYPEQIRLNTNIASKDEIKTLENEVNNMICRLLRHRNQA